MSTTKSKTTESHKKHVVKLRHIIVTVAVGCTVCIVAAIIVYSFFEQKYKNKIYPTVSVGEIPFGDTTRTDVEKYWEMQNTPFTNAVFELVVEDHIATVSGTELELGYDAALSAQQAYLVGRSGYFFSDLYTKLFKGTTDLTPYFRWNSSILEEKLDSLAAQIDVPVEEALFDYSEGKVTAFRPSRDGRRLNTEYARKEFTRLLTTIHSDTKFPMRISLTADRIAPTATTENANSLGIRELIGRGYSEFHGSIAGRIHNVALAASRLNGVLIKPGEELSFNDAIGDISAATGYQSAYIIKDGRTILGDGGGVCQVSTTLFRAALNAGLPVLERKPHAYRVHYYEEGGFKAGIDATVFAPSVDLRIKNDTAGYILIQTKTDTKNLSLVFELYGTSDGRRAEVINHVVSGVTPPPPALYQDDPTLPAGVVKQVDFAAWGARASFDYKVYRGDEILQDTKFVSAYRPWQAVYLRGTATQ